MSGSSSAAAPTSKASTGAQAAELVEAPAPPADGRDVKETLQQSIMRLKAEQAAAKSAKRAVAKSLRNAQKRASRLKKRARQLTDNDLVEVLKMRESKPGEVMAPGADEATGASSASGSASSAATPS